MEDTSTSFETSAFEIQFEAVDERINLITEGFIRVLGNSDDELGAEL